MKSSTAWLRVAARVKYATPLRVRSLKRSSRNDDMSVGKVFLMR